MAQGSFLDGGRYLARIFTSDANAGSFFKKIIDAINTLGINTGVSPNGDNPPPPPVTKVTVKSAGETIHAVADHPGTISRGIKYVWQVSANDPAFSQPHNFPSESRTFMQNFPTKDDGGHMVNYYVRVIPQYRGSQAQTPTAYGGTTPAAVTLSGSTAMTLLPSTGAGTAANNGQQGLQGLGSFQSRVQKQIVPTPGT
jgi:hypothetical protein